MGTIEKTGPGTSSWPPACEEHIDPPENYLTTLGQAPETWMRLVSGIRSRRVVPLRHLKEGSKQILGTELPQILIEASQRSEKFLEGILVKLAAEYSPSTPGKQGIVCPWSEGHAFQSIVDSLKGLESRLASIESKIESLQSSKGSLVVTVNTFSPEPYDVVRSIQLAVYPLEEGYCASFYDANLHSTGDTDEESVSNLKSLILDTFESLSSEEPNNLGPEPLRQLTVLKEFLVPRP